MPVLLTLAQESYSPDDNSESQSQESLISIKYSPLCLLGFDLRPFLYPAKFPWQFKKIDAAAARLPDKSNQPPLPQAEQPSVN